MDCYNIVLALKELKCIIGGHTWLFIGAILAQTQAKSKFVFIHCCLVMMYYNRRIVIAKKQCNATK